MTKNNLYEMFQTDPELVAIWHIKAGEGLKACVEDTWNIINGQEMFLIDEGYFSKCKSADGIDCLNGFFVYPKYRNKDGITSFWSKVWNEFSELFICPLHKKNTRATDFMIRSGAQLIESPQDPSVVYLVCRRS